MVDPSGKNQELLEENRLLRQRIREREHSEVERIRVEEALRRSEENYRQLFDNAPTGIYKVDFRTGKLLKANDVICEYLGCSQEEVTSTSPFDFLTEESKRLFLERMAKMGLGEKVEENPEFEIVDKDGVHRWVQLSIKYICDREGRIIGADVVAHEITARKQAEAERRRDRDTMARMVEEMAVIAEIGRVIGSTLDIDEVYERFAVEARKLIPFDRLSINLNNHEQNAAIVVYVFGSNIPGRNPGDSCPLQGSVNETLERTRRGMLLHPTGTDELKGQYPHLLSTFEEGMRSLMGVPLITRDRVIGVLHFRSKEPDIYKEQDLRLAERIGAQIAGAIANAHLYKELKKTEEWLRESGQRYQLLVENANEAILVIQDGAIKFLNSQTVESFGYSVEELISSPIFEFIHPEDRDRVSERYRQKINGDATPSRHTYRTIHKSGRIQWIEISSVRIEWEGRPATLNLITDITERRQAEKELFESVEKYRLLADNSSDVIWTMNLEGHFTYVSPSVKDMAGYTPEEAMAIPLEKYVFDEDLPWIMDEFYKELQKSREERSTRRTIQIRQYKKDRSVLDVEVSFGWLYNGQGELAGVQGTTRDISTRKRLEEERTRLERQLRQSQKMEALGQLAGGVAHDLNNILGILSGYSELLLLEIPEGGRARSHAEKILQSTVKGAAIIQDLLTLARRGVTVSEVINLNGVVSGFLKAPVFEKMKDYNHQVAFRTELDPNLLNIKGSPVHLEKTLMNLVANAAESITGRGEVAIRTESRYLDKPVGGYDEIQEGDYAVLTVSDTGMGIPAENREKIFEPFYTKKTMGRSGTGLGLAIVWGTVKDHNGYIDLQTEIGKGTTFRLYFPATREEMVEKQQKLPMEQYMGQGESVLVVDDVAEQRDVASRMLTRLGYKVHAVSGGEDAVEYLKVNRADILVLDMIMAPGIDGLETYRRILEINPQQKAILVSGFSQTERVNGAQKLGAGAYVKKPYVIERIGMAVRDELNKK